MWVSSFSRTLHCFLHISRQLTKLTPQTQAKGDVHFFHSSPAMKSLSVIQREQYEMDFNIAQEIQQQIKQEQSQLTLCSFAPPIMNNRKYDTCLTK